MTARIKPAAPEPEACPLAKARVFLWLAVSAFRSRHRRAAESHPVITGAATGLFFAAVSFAVWGLLYGLTVLLAGWL